jgi:tetratricopeptide (TPR) repeat protein
LLSLAALATAGCSQFNMLKARSRVKDAHALYQRQDYTAAAAAYEEAIHLDAANQGAAYFYLGNSYDNLYKPARQGEPQNDAYLTKAVENYKLATERAPDDAIKLLALKYLAAVYGPDKLNDPASAEPVMQQMIAKDPTDPTNYFQLSKLYEDAGRYDEAESVLLKARDTRPNDSATYLQLAGYYNRQGEFEKTMDALRSRAEREPNNPEAYYTIATYYWEKAFRDFRLKEPEKMDYTLKGIESIDKAISLKSDYMEAFTYKNLLLRVQANLEKDPKKQQELMKQALALEAKAAELRKLRAGGVG